MWYLEMLLSVQDSYKKATSRKEYSMKESLLHDLCG